jgi:hypothetical protein
MHSFSHLDWENALTSFIKKVVYNIHCTAAKVFKVGGKKGSGMSLECLNCTTKKHICIIFPDKEGGNLNQSVHYLQHCCYQHYGPIHTAHAVCTATMSLYVIK